MAEQKIELRKIRDFSENLNDTFVFIRQNLKPLLISFLGIAGVFMLAAAIFNGLYQSRMGSIFKQIFAGGSAQFVSTSFFSGTYFLLLIFGWLNIVAMKVTLIAYMKVYDEKGRQTPTMQEVWREFSKYFLKVFIYSFPIIILIVIGCVFCLAPGVYLFAVLMPFEMLLIVEDRSFSDAFNRCFVIIKQNFWMSLGIYIVAYIIYSFSSGIVGAVAGIIGGLLSYFTTRDINKTIGFATSIINIFSFVFFIVYYVSSILNYFSLTEKFEGTGMINRLNMLGQTSADINNIEEQY